ncbi:uncharacterized protein [Apostichopus japonicus]
MDSINPEDSVSLVNIVNNPDKLKGHTDSEVSVKTTVSVLLYRTKQKEIEIAARAAALKETKKLEERKRNLQVEYELQEAQDEIRHAQEKAERVKQRKQMEEKKLQLETEQQEIDMMAELEAAKAMSRLLQLHERPESDVSAKLTKEVVKSIELKSFQYSKSDDEAKKHSEGENTRINPNAKKFVSRQNITVPDKPNDSGKYLSPNNGNEHAQYNQTKPTYAGVCYGQPLPDITTKPDDTVNTGISMATLLNKIVDHQRESALPSPRLDPFDGSDLLSFTPFIRNFQHVVEDKTQNPARRLELLLRFTEGEAHDLIKECTAIEPPASGYERAKWLLQRNFGQPQVLAAAYKSKAESWDHIAVGDKIALRKYAIFLINCCNVQQGNPEMDSMNGYEFLRILAQKLPTALQQQWINQMGRFRDVEMRSPTLQDFEQFVGQHSRNENDPRIAGLGYQNKMKDWKTPQKYPKVVTSKRAFAATVKTNEDDKAFKGKNEKMENKAKISPCLYCGPNTYHTLLDCRKFGSLDLQAKSDVCMKKGLCFGCLNPGHLKRNCPNPEWAKCEKCSKSHPTILHDPAREKKSSDERVTQTVTTGCAGVQNVRPQGNKNKMVTGTLMAITPVLIKPKTSDRCIATYAFVDNGCGAVFVDEFLKDSLKVNTRRTKILIKTLNLQQVQTTDVIVGDLQVGNINGTSFIDLHSVYVKDSIPATMDDAPTQNDIDAWDHLSHIKLPSMDGHNSIPHVTLMIGSNVPGVSMPLEIASAEIGDPYAIKTPIGWLVYGLEGKWMDQPEVNVNFCRVDNGIVQNGTDNLEQQLQSFINMDFTERLSDQKIAMSVEDKRFMTMMEESVTKVHGHYETVLPLRDRAVKMPNNKVQADMFGLRLQRKLKTNEKLASEYTEFMENLEKKGYAEKVPDQDVDRNDGNVWYIPHHAVYHPKKPDKIRVVFNCPIQYKGVSLNEQLLSGPDLTNRLYGVLMRWRQENVAIMADIEAMFYQVRVRKDDCDLLRYLWWPEGNFDGGMKEYRMLVHLFGAVSSPSCANFALKRTASDNQHRFQDKVIESVINDFYVDDFLKSVATDEEGIQIYRDLKEIMASGGFKLGKWVSNSKRLLESIPEDDRAKELKGLDLENDELPKERALGVQWCVERDQLEFNITKVNEKATRRNILSVMSAVYDPIGYASPFLLQAKKILQSLCRLKVDWDSDIPDDQRNEWEKWLKELPILERLKIPRCLKPKEFGKVVNIQMHYFADASQEGYGTATYMRYTNDRKEIHCAFLTGKARVAPLKPHTIVKMELTAATSAVKQDAQLKQELTMNIDETVFWTDSQTVLKYIRSEKARHPVFVANRIAIIHDGSDVHQWRYVPSKLNPADHASRGLSADDLLTKEDWLNGPEFLHQTEDFWPCEDDSNDADSDRECEKEVSVSAVTMTDETQKNPVEKLLEYHSEWNKLKRSVAWWLRLKTILLQRIKRHNPNQCSQGITSDEMESAEKAIIKFIQRQSFPEEIGVLQKTKTAEMNIKDPCGTVKQASDKGNRCLRQKGRLTDLDPELHDEIMRVGGRLRKASIPLNAKHQMILPKDHHVSKLIIRHIHQLVGHQGRNHVLAELRQKYWIIHAGSMIRSLLKRCIQCRKYLARTGKQKMADLPAYRLRPDEGVFSRTGVDYFGPFEIKQGRTLKKRYGVMFTCLSSRAVHIEVAHSLDTNSCIGALRRFMARRGHVRELYSDNGTNFVGANKELKSALQELDENQINRFASNHGLKWKFNPPAASHFGGVWERQIRTVRKVLSGILSEQYLRTTQSDEQLHTFLCEVETIINSRPLTKVSDNPNDLDVITPNHLLLLKAPVDMPLGKFDEKDVYARRRWRQMQYLADLFWKRWTKEYLPTLQRRQKWLQPERCTEVGDVVMIVDDQSPRNSWLMGVVIEAYKDKGGLVRSAKIKTKTATLVRPVVKLCLLLEGETT